MKNLKKKLLSKWDWFVYRRSYKSINRILIENPHYAYLFELHVRDLDAGSKLTPELKSSAEVFHDSMKREIAKNAG